MRWHARVSATICEWYTKQANKWMIILSMNGIIGRNSRDKQESKMFTRNGEAKSKSNQLIYYQFEVVKETIKTFELHTPMTTDICMALFPSFRSDQRNRGKVGIFVCEHLPHSQCLGLGLLRRTTATEASMPLWNVRGNNEINITLNMSFDFLLFLAVWAK